DVADVLRLDESLKRPRLAAVGGLPHAVAMRDVAAQRILAAADVDDVRIRRRDLDGADRPAEIPVRDGSPGVAAVGALEHAAARRAEVVLVGTRRAAHDGDGAAA